MLVFKIVLIGIAGAILVMITKQFKPEYSIPVLLGICLFLIGYLTTGLEEVLKFVQSLQKEIPINNMYIKILFKLLAIAYICQIASNICEDLGYRSISDRNDRESIDLTVKYSNYPIITRDRRVSPSIFLSS